MDADGCRLATEESVSCQPDEDGRMTSTMLKNLMAKVRMPSVRTRPCWSPPLEPSSSEACVTASPA